MDKSKEIIFDVKVQSGKECKFELGLVELSSKQLIPVYMTDEFGRNIKVKLDEDGMTLFEISPYKKEELIFDIKENRKITVDKFIKSYLKGDGMKMISSLNNKIVVQENEKINLFTLKSESESERFIDCVSSHFFKIRRSDCLFVKDSSTPQRKYLYTLLEASGIDKKILYRKFTTLPQSK